MPTPGSGPHKMITGRDLEQLTRQAVQAAERGDWGVVQDCYRQRGEMLGRFSTTADHARTLVALDAVVTDRLVLARAAIQQVLADLTRVRRRSRTLAAAAVRSYGVGEQVDHLT